MNSIERCDSCQNYIFLFLIHREMIFLFCHVFITKREKLRVFYPVFLSILMILFWQFQYLLAHHRDQLGVWMHALESYPLLSLPGPSQPSKREHWQCKQNFGTGWIWIIKSFSLRSTKERRLPKADSVSQIQYLLHFEQEDASARTE